MRETITRSQSLQEQRHARRMEGGARAVSDLLVARQIATGRIDGGKDAAAEMSRDGQPPAIMLLMGGGRHLGEARKLINVLRQLYRVGVVRTAREAVR